MPIRRIDEMQARRQQVQTLQSPVGMVGLAFHRQPLTAMERRPYRVLQLPLM